MLTKSTYTLHAFGIGDAVSSLVKVACCSAHVYYN